MNHMNDANLIPSIEAGPLALDARSTTWLLDLPCPSPDFFVLGLAALRPSAEQTVIGRVVAECGFTSGGDDYTAVAILALAARGVHRLLDVAIRQVKAANWPTLCTDFRLDFDFAAAPVVITDGIVDSSNADRWSTNPSARWAARQALQQRA